MTITRIVPPVINVQDDGYLISPNVDTINFRHGLSVGGIDSNISTIDGYLRTENSGIFIVDSYAYNFNNDFQVSTDGYGTAYISLSDTANQLSPGFTWGRSGTTNAGAYLLNDTVPSNLTGRIVSLNAYIVEVFVANELANTFDVAIQKRIGPSTFATLVTISLVSQRLKTQSVFVSVNDGDELVALVSSGAAKNPVVGLVLQGM
jgi:hypothetical protein